MVRLSPQEAKSKLQYDIAAYPLRGSKSCPALTTDNPNQMKATITINALSEQDLTNILINLATVISDPDVSSYELMDGSYQIGQANLELEPTP